METVRKGKEMLEKGGERSIPSLYFPYALIRLLDHNVGSGDIVLFLNTGWPPKCQ